MRRFFIYDEVFGLLGDSRLKISKSGKIISTINIKVHHKDTYVQDLWAKALEEGVGKSFAQFKLELCGTLEEDVHFSYPDASLVEER